MVQLIRFDWAVKKLLRNKANFGVLEGFMSELLGFDVKIEQILESESNKQYKEDKFNRVDILVRTEQGELMLIEIQNEAETDYFHRILYGSSKLITEYIKEGEGYTSVKKVVSISILYFRLGQGKDYIYEYDGKFVGRHLKDTLYPNAWQKDKFGIKEVADIFPKYYILKVNNFDDIAKDTLDEWIYFLKNSEVPVSFKAKGLQEAAEKLKADQLSVEDRKEYEKYRESRWIEKDVLETAEKKGFGKGFGTGFGTGFDKGFDKGAFQKSIEIAKKSIAKGFDNETIIDLTGLSVAQIEDLRVGKTITIHVDASPDVEMEE